MHLSMFFLSFSFVIVCGLFAWKQICAGFVSRLFIYVLTFSRVGGWDPFNRFNPAILLCLSQASIWISNVIYCGLSFAFSD